MFVEQRKIGRNDPNQSRSVVKFGEMDAVSLLVKRL